MVFVLFVGHPGRPLAIEVIVIVITDLRLENRFSSHYLS